MVNFPFFKSQVCVLCLWLCKEMKDLKPSVKDVTPILEISSQLKIKKLVLVCQRSQIFCQSLHFCITNSRTMTMNKIMSLCYFA